MTKKLNPDQSLIIRLASYAASAGALITLCPSVKSQVVYSGPQNSVLYIPEEFQMIDIDGDLTDDFGFFMYGSNHFESYDSYIISSVNGYAALFNARTDVYNSWLTQLSIFSVGSSFSNNYSLADGLFEGEKIGDMRSNWMHLEYPYYFGALGAGYKYQVFGPYYSGSYGFSAGEFIDKERYLGVRFFIGEDVHYGWIRALLSSEFDSVTVFDWAYQSVPDSTILAGEGLVAEPAPAILLTGGGGYSGEPRTLSLTSDHEFSGLELDDLNLFNAAADQLETVVTGYSYTFVVSAVENGYVLVELPDSAVTFTIGGYSNQVKCNWVYFDSSLTIEMGKIIGEDVISQRTVTVWVQSDKDVYGMELSDFVISNGTTSDFTGNDPGQVYTFNVTAVNEGVVSVTLPEGAVTGYYGVENEEISINWTYDDQIEAVDEETISATRIYPNPVNDVLHIETETPSDISILNLNGTAQFQAKKLPINLFLCGVLNLVFIF